MLDCTLKRIRRDKHIISTFFDSHKHEHDEITYYISGRGTTKIGDKYYEYRPKTFAFNPAGTLHDEKNPRATEVLWLHFKVELEGLSLKEGLFDDPGGELLSALVKLRGAYMDQKAFSKIIVEARLAEAVAIAARIQQSNGVQRSMVDWQEILEYIDENATTAIDFTALAAKYNYSYDRFRHLFREKFDNSPQSYLISRRVQRAKHMILHTSLSLTDIAYDCGFTSSSQFSNIFLKYTGVTPGRYKKNAELGIRN